MEFNKTFIVDENGKKQAVILDYELFKKIEDLLLDVGLGKAMEKIAGEEELDIEEAKRLLGIGSDESES